jgi:MFS family permease
MEPSSNASLSQPDAPPSAAMMIFTGTLVTMVVVMFARAAYGIILPFMRENLGLSYQQAGNLGTACALGYLCLVMHAGAFAARYGSRRSILLGLSLCTLGFIGLTQFSSYAVLLCLMVVLGFGTAFTYTPLMSLLSNWFPARRGAIIGTVNSGVGIGMLLCGWLVPFLNQAVGSAGWRTSWAVFAVAAAATAACAWFFLPDPRHRADASRAGEAPPDKAAVYRNPHVIVVGAIYGLIGITYMVQSVFMVSFAIDAGVSAQTAGQLMALMGILSIASSPFFGWVLDRFGRTVALSGSLILTLFGTLVPIFWPTLPGFAAHYIILGCTTSGMFTSVLVASTETVQPRQAPLAVSYVTFFYAVGQLVGPAMGGLLIEQAGGFRGAFAVSCAVIAIGVYLSWRLKNPRTAAAQCESAAVK